ncbi:hypothetical protein Goklo_023949 [Gossypium klotzschianum]|uniref:Uncharacterized protein n=1 Tax=Gossypium klotzschianum TaxID=34286 RepID=A0A7J8W644_9ROSI|nr:hypothetical protein [Gossypium klotzschianum]
MHTGEQGKVDSLDVRSSYLHGSTITFGRLIKFCIRICRRGISSGELHGASRQDPI